MDFLPQIIFKMNSCPCGTSLVYSECCEPFITGLQNPSTPEKLMRSRYTAYTLADAGYIISTTTPSKRALYNYESILHWAENSQWQKLEVLNAKDNQVEFKAYYLEQGTEKVHHELSFFKKEGGKWYFDYGIEPKPAAKTGRNEPCPCGSGKKYKKCCG